MGYCRLPQRTDHTSARSGAVRSTFEHPSIAPDAFHDGTGGEIVSDSPLGGEILGVAWYGVCDVHCHQDRYQDGFANHEQTGIFDIDTRMKQDDEQDEGQEMTYWQHSKECNWDTGGWPKSTGLADSKGQASTTKNMSSTARMVKARAMAVLEPRTRRQLMIEVDSLYRGVDSHKQENH